MKHGWNTDFFEARQGWHICSIAIHQRTKLRQERHHRACGQKMPPRMGLKFILVWRLQICRARRRCGKAGNPLPAADCQRTHSGSRRRRARSDAPYHGATPKTATGTGALPSKVPVGGRAPAPANGSLGWTNGRLNFYRAKGAKAAKSRSGAMTIAQPFMAGYRVNQMKKSREGRQNGSFVPGRDFGKLLATSPSHKWLGYFQGKRARRRKRPPGRARAPAKSQPGGQWQFGVDERGKGCLNPYEITNV